MTGQTKALRHWTDIAPADAVDVALPQDGIVGPVNENGEPCPWPWEPQQLVDAPLGQYHCPYCLAMVIAGVEHLDYTEPCFEATDVVELWDRGPVIIRTPEAAREAWLRGERWTVGQVIVCGELIATIVGIERFAVAAGHPAYNDGSLLLRGVEFDDLAVGQRWVDKDAL